MMRPIHINNSAGVRRIAEYCAGAATRVARDRMACPRGILEHIVDFFTPGAVRREKVKAYDEFAEAMTVALFHASVDVHACAIPERLVVEFSGYTVTFTQQGEHHNAADQVTIEVSKSGETTTARVNKQTFCRISTALLLRRQGGLPSTAVVLKDDNRIDLQWANLSGANLSGANLYGADLWGVDLSAAKLLRANLSGANLCGANLSVANLWGANLCGVNLRGVNLWGVNLWGANLNGANLSRANLSRADLSGANLYEADLSGANLSRADLSGADLSGANLSRANLNGADLNGADLSWASLSKVDLSGANLNRANLSNISQEGALLCLPNEWNSTALDAYLNHINNRTSGSLLTMMDSIDEQYADVKLRMARELMTSLQNTTADTSSVALPLMDILSKAPYTGDAEINAWLDTLCERYLSQYNGQVLPENAGVFNQSVDLFTRQSELMFTHNGAFIQIIAQGMAENSTPAMKEKASVLYETYLQQEQVKPYCSLDDFGDGEGKPDWADKHPVNFILLSARPAAVSAMLLSQASLKGMLSPRADAQWDRFYLYNSPDHCLAAKEYPHLNTLFANDFPLFNGPYQHVQNSAKFLLLLKALNLGGLETAFVSATGAKYSATKLVDDDAQIRLGEIFHPKLVSSLLQPRGNGLEEEHYGELIHAYNLTRASSADKAKTLLCLAALFTKYSSSAVFGTEHESPQLLRHYAYALMEKAHGLDESLVDKGTLANWTNRLLGLKGAFTCSAVLSNLMVEHIRSRFPEVLSGIMPPAWG